MKTGLKLVIIYIAIIAIAALILLMLGIDNTGHPPGLALYMILFTIPGSLLPIRLGISPDVYISIILIGILLNSTILFSIGYLYTTYKNYRKHNSKHENN